MQSAGGLVLAPGALLAGDVSFGEKELPQGFLEHTLIAYEMNGEPLPQSWRRATLGEDLGKYSWRQWSFALKFDKTGELVVMARAANRIGATQTMALIANPAGYHHNVIQRIKIDVS